MKTYDKSVKQTGMITKIGARTFANQDDQTASHNIYASVQHVAFLHCISWRKVMNIVAFAIVFIVGSTNTVQAQDDLLLKPYFSFEVFQEQVSGVSVPGFRSVTEFEDNEYEGEYLAIYVNGEDVFFIKIEYRDTKGIDSPHFYLNDNAAEFYTMNDLTFLMVDLPAINSILTLGSNKLENKTDFEAIAHQTGFLELESEIASWPSIIPPAYRIEGTLIEVNASEGSDTGYYRAEARVALLMSETVKNSLLKLMQDFDGSEEVFIRFPDETILNLPFSSIEEIDDFYAPQSIIRFTYYIP